MGRRVPRVGPMVGTKVSKPQARALSRARGTLRRASPAQVVRNTATAERVMPASQPPRASLDSPITSWMRGR
jgi:hypothetical protein